MAQLPIISLLKFFSEYNTRSRQTLLVYKWKKKCPTLLLYLQTKKIQMLNTTNVNRQFDWFSYTKEIANVKQTKNNSINILS